ncbi:MAG: MCE family protein [Bdellovibrionales bacterium CG10_big_fil_rev_8_21_14_0_10_45_34]|nr:MAG: MCE family protein [Bdellovibrionales bacterium CG10_big_fil_rev_8_21_14_0_10_45_34]
MKSEYKVGLLFLVSVGLVIVFAFAIGALGPFRDSYKLTVLYNFAGGIEEGSPVRVMGIKVGKVQRIRFEPGLISPSGEEVQLAIDIAVDKKAWRTVRSDSQFFINIAGLIGEKFVEITPGRQESPQLADGQLVRGEDPPRVDQLLSQGYGLAGKILEMVEKNEGKFSDTIFKLNDLVKNVNKTLVLLEKATHKVEVNRLLQNMVKITDDVAKVSSKMSSEEAQKTYDFIHTLIWRLEPLDKEAIKEFLQEEGVRARIF